MLPGRVDYQFQVTGIVDLFHHHLIIIIMVEAVVMVVVVVGVSVSVSVSVGGGGGDHRCFVLTHFGYVFDRPVLR